jgi:flagellin
MGLRIKTNIQSLMAQRQLTDNQTKMTESLEKLSSGYRINKSADDAAGLAVSESMKAKIRSLGQAKRNASDGISFLQVAEGGLSEINNMVVRMRELTTQAASDTIGASERTFLNREFVQLAQEVKRVVGSTEFNGHKVLSSEDAAASEGLSIQVGANFRVPGKEVSVEDESVKISFEQVSALNESLAGLQDLNIEGENSASLGGSSADEIFKILDGAMIATTDFRASLGAMQSRMNSAITAIDVGVENMEAAQSRIRDVDYAGETAKLTQSRILAAAGTAVLSQANALPETVLQLLRA